MQTEASETITMPKWPAYVMLGVMALCTYPVLTAAAPAPAPTIESAGVAPVPALERAALRADEPRPVRSGQ